jgi:hypothetical protein
VRLAFNAPFSRQIDLAKSCKNTGIWFRIDEYGAKSCENTGILYNFYLFGLNGLKISAQSQEFSRFGYFSPEKLHFCSFVFLQGFIFRMPAAWSRSIASNFGTGGSSQRD